MSPKNTPKSLIDTNLIIRFFTGDDPQKALKVDALLNSKATKKVIPDLIIAEIIYVLKSVYQFDKSTIIPKLRVLISTRSILCNKKLLLNTLSLWQESNISFVDAYLATLASSKSWKLYSYDERFDKIDPIMRLEP